ncbi:hypothetical protein CP061683_2562B, partial [Chlamydia psittaci 06-1683]
DALISSNLSRILCRKVSRYD